MYAEIPYKWTKESTNLEGKIGLSLEARPYRINSLTDSHGLPKLAHLKPVDTAQVVKVILATALG